MGGSRRITGRLKEVLPAKWTTVLRSCALGWGMATSRFRMTPDFIVVGAQRAGTTTLFRILSEHPDAVRPTLSKGIGYFDVNHQRGWRWYLGHFPLSFPARLRTGGRARAFESSGYCLFHPLAAQRIADELPDAKVVVMVRDPVERAYSAHRHELMRGFETQDFPTALALEAERLSGEEDKIRADGGYQSFEHRHHGYLARSRYAGQIARYIEALGADRVHIVDADALFADASELTALFAFLGLSSWAPDHVGRHNAQPRTPMSAELRHQLEESFVEDDLALAEQMGRTPHWRRAERLAGA